MHSISTSMKAIEFYKFNAPKLAYELYAKARFCTDVFLFLTTPNPAGWTISH